MTKLINNDKTLASPIKCLGPIADLENHLPEEWWKGLFNSIYLKTDSDVVENEENTIADIDNLIRVTNISPTDKVLDLCCGQGRHVLELANRGFENLMGIDRSRYLIRLARKRAEKIGTSQRIAFSEGDARKIRPATASFACVTLLGNSFGYFEHQDDDLKVLKEANRVLSSNGVLYLDITDGNWMKNNFQPRGWEWIDQSLIVCRERHLSSASNRLICREVVIDVNKGVIVDQFYAERFYCYDALKDLLSLAGFRCVELIGNMESSSTRGHDLGMMANRLIVKAIASTKIENTPSLSKNTKTKVTVLLGDPKIPDKIKRDGHFNEEDLETVEKLKEALSELGDYEFSWVDNHSTLLQTLGRKKPSLVFNLCDEGFNNDPEKELHIPAILEMQGIPFTGSPPAALAVCYDKAIVRAIALSLEIPVPEEILINSVNGSAAIPGILPTLLKPAKGDSSIGITQKAVVKTSEELIAYFDWLKSELPDTDILAQEFLCGREFSLGVIGNPSSYEVLPVLEVDYSKLSDDLPKILCYESKWLPDSDYWNNISYIPAELNEKEYRNLVDMSTKLFERLGCRDYARFDFREDSNGVMKLLEVNPNPGWCWDGKLNLMASFSNITYPMLLHKILLAACERIRT